MEATDAATLDDVAGMVASLQDEVRQLRRELRDAKSRMSQELVRVQDFADRMDISRGTVYRRAKKRGIPMRDAHGYPKEDGDRSAAYVSVTEWEAAEKIDTRTVRQNAGFYE